MVFLYNTFSEANVEVICIPYFVLKKNTTKIMFLSINYLKYDIVVLKFITIVRVSLKKNNLLIMKATLLTMFTLMVFWVNTPVYPRPYSGVVDEVDVDGITSVAIDGTIKANTNIVVFFSESNSYCCESYNGDTYTIVLKGNTNGNYPDQFIAYLDWNQNNVLNDVEPRASSLFANSTGYVAQGVSLTFAVPEDYYLSYGQMLDFDINIEEETASTPTLDLNQFWLHPNLASDYIRIEYKDNLKNATIMDVQGRKMSNYSLTKAQLKIDVSELAAETFFYTYTKCYK